MVWQLRNCSIFLSVFSLYLKGSFPSANFSESGTDLDLYRDCRSHDFTDIVAPSFEDVAILSVQADFRCILEFPMHFCCQRESNQTFR